MRASSSTRARARRSTGVLFGILALGIQVQRGLIRPVRRRTGPSFWPHETGSGRPIDRRFGLGAVGRVAYPDPHAGGGVEDLHPRTPAPASDGWEIGDLRRAPA